MRVRARIGPPREAAAMRRLLAGTLAIVACAPALGCGGDDADTAARGERDRTPFITLPEAEGVDRSEAQDEEEPIVVDGLHYDPLVARRLNPDIAPDRTLVSGLKPPAGKIWFGVFLRVCNRGEQTRTSSDRLALVDAFGQRTTPSEALPQDNVFAYEPRTLDAGRCLPREGSVAERSDGALVLFAVGSKTLSETPVALVVEDRRVILDV